MHDDIETVRALYAAFNARDIDAVLASLAPDVAWANAMEGGHVHGPDAVREYWTRQWAVVSPRVEPLRLTSGPDGSIAVEVRQSIYDLEGNLVDDGSEGLATKTVGHLFAFRDGKVRRFDVREAG